MWSYVVIGLVLFAAVASALLAIAALRQWRGAWRWGAALPLLCLLLWFVYLVLLRGDAPLWQLELFAWAMLTLVYMMALLTARRIIAKAGG